jgi:hypothetical protein
MRLVAVLLVAIALVGCGTRSEVRVFGQTVNLPPAPGMRALNRIPNSPSGEVCLARYAPDRLHATEGRLPYIAMASALPRGNEDSSSARAWIAVGRASEPLGTRDPAILSAWETALRSGLAGRRDPLPAAPEGLVRIERLDTPPDEFAEVLMMQRTIMANSALLVRGRAIQILVSLDDPKDTADLAAVRSEMTAWVDAIRAANQ